MKSEVRSLEQAVCGLVTKLNLLLTAEYGLDLFKAGEGLHISTPDHLTGDDAFVTIRPTGWPEGSRISARFYRSARGWILLEGGEIWADHLTIPVRHLRFKSAENIMGLTLDTTGGREKQFVTHGYERLIESLQEDLKKHL